jgi:general secretion pathway protein F
MRAGENSGQLAQMLHRAAAYHESETARWVERFSRAFEPILMAVIGLIIGVIVLFLYMPIFELAGHFR